MADYIIQDSTLTAIADAVRGKTGSTEAMSPMQMATAIEGISTGGGGSSGGEEWIGDGNTHLWISLPEGRTAPMLGVCPKGTVTVDWGDGTTPDVLTGTSTSTVKWTPNHEYGKAGDYVITLTVDGQMVIEGLGSGSSGSDLLRFSASSDNRNYVYQNAVRKIEFGSGMTSIGGYAAYYCQGLKSVLVPENVKSIGTDAFEECRNLESVSFFNGVTKLTMYSFSNCYSLASVVFPNSLQEIQNYAFSSCYGVKLYDFTACTAVPTLGSVNAFGGIPADCEIRVPAALAEEWKAATNWSTFASKIVGV